MIARRALAVLVGVGLLALIVAAAVASPGVDVVVNDPSLDDAFQNETTLAVRGSTICAGYNDAGPGGFSGLSRSPDLGATWIDQGGIPQSGDPVLAVHEATGTFYYAQLAFLSPGVRTIGVARSTDGCQTFPAIADASPLSANADDLQDKPWIAVDNTGGARDGDIYVCWTDITDPAILPPPADVRVSRSTDGGLTFTDEQVVSLPADAIPVGCYVDVGPGGEVYVTWANGDFGAGDFTVRIRRSLDGGLAWGGAVQVNSAPVRYPGIDRIVVCDPFRPTLNGDIRMTHQTWMAVDTTGGPFDGRIYVVWQHDPPGAVDNSDVYFSSSADGGLTWSPQLQVAGGTITDQFEPFVEVAGDGAVSIAWYDRRNDPANNYNIDVYTTFSTNGGLTLHPLTRLTDVSFPPITYGCYMGEYIAVAGDASNFYYAWGDNRNSDPDVYFDSVAVPQLKDPNGDPDNDTLPNVSDPDDDNDGCTDGQEHGPDPNLGGLRDANHFWDFFDTPDAANVRNKTIDLFIDIFAVAGRFGADDAGGTAVINRNTDPLSAPPASPAYHPAFDRGGVIGANPWNVAKADGSVDLFNDIFGVANQFGHDCV
ncbi:MAG: sialidase family protein [Dehalococcoidia bacterium]|nr:sialidase family protein [Dehalococcoidia bacterium]